MEKVSAVVVTYNRVNVLKTCLKHLLLQTYPLNNIIVINNASTDNTKKYLIKNQRQNKNIIVKNMSKNVGGSGGFNMGLRIGVENTDSDLFWIMDDDTITTNNTLKELVRSAKKLHNNFGFLCSNVRSKEGNYPANQATVDSNSWSILQPSNLIKVRRATFVSFMVPRYNIIKLGLPIAPMFIWGDDLEYSFRMYDYKPCYFVSTSIAIHNSDRSANIFNMPSSRNIYLKYGFRNELYAYRKHCRVQDIIMKIIKDIYLIIKAPFASKNHRLKKVRYMIMGFIKGFLFNPKVEFPKDSKMNNKIK